MSNYENWSTRDKSPETTQQSAFGTNWRDAQQDLSQLNSNLESATKELVQDGLLPSLDLHHDDHPHHGNSNGGPTEESSVGGENDREGGSGRDGRNQGYPMGAGNGGTNEGYPLAGGNGSGDLLVDKLLSDPAIVQALQSAAAQMSPQGLAALEQSLGQSLSLNPYTPDSVLAQQSVTQLTQEGAPASDLTALQSMATSLGGSTPTATTGGDGGTGTPTTPTTGGDGGTGTPTTPTTGGDGGIGTPTTPTTGGDGGTGTPTTPTTGGDGGTVAPIVGDGNFVAKGGHIYDPSGNVFEPKGANIDPTQLPTDPTALASYVANMKNNWDFNFVRLNLGDGSGVPDSSRLQQIVQAFTSQGMVVELEQHVHNADISQANPSLYQQWATQFKGNPYVWFGTPNELGTSNNPGSSWLSTEEAVDSAIRGTGNQNIILQGDSDWGQGNTTGGDSALLQYAQQLQQYGNIVATEHVYNNDGNAYQQLSTAISQLNNAGYGAEMIDEYGETNWINGTPVSTENGAQAVIQAGEQLGVGSAVWRWTPDSNALTNNSDGNIDDITPYGQMVLNFNKYPQQ